jgi:hypothetical protein
MRFAQRYAESHDLGFAEKDGAADDDGEPTLD